MSPERDNLDPSTLILDAKGWNISHITATWTSWMAKTSRVIQVDLQLTHGVCFFFRAQQKSSFYELFLNEEQKKWRIWRESFQQHPKKLPFGLVVILI